MTDLLDPAASIVGLQILTEDSVCKCGCDLAIVRVGRAMHAAGLLCSKCGGFRQWLSLEKVESIADLFCAMKRTIGTPDTIRIRTKKVSAQAESAADMGEPAASATTTPITNRTERPQSMDMSDVSKQIFEGIRPQWPRG
jgi:hypothetical protein